MTDAPAITPRPSIDRRTIPYAHWSPRSGRRADRPYYGEIVAQFADLEQGIANVILTPKGSVPTSPEKCCDVLSFMDRPPAVAIPALMVEIFDGLTAWHPRITVDEVDVVPVLATDAGLSHFRTRVFWRPADGVAESFVTLVDVTREGLLTVQPAGLA